MWSVTVRYDYDTRCYFNVCSKAGVSQTWNPLNSYQIPRNHLDLSCPLTTPLYLLSSTNMLQSSTNSPGTSLHQTHGFLPPSVHFGPPFATLKTSGNVLTLLLTGPSSSLSATNTTSSSCLPKKSTSPASYLQPPTTPNVFGKQSTNS